MLGAASKRAFTLRLRDRHLRLHGAGILCGVLQIVFGLLVATGQFVVLRRWALRTPVTQWMPEAAEALRALLFGR